MLPPHFDESLGLFSLLLKFSLFDFPFMLLSTSPSSTSPQFSFPEVCTMFHWGMALWVLVIYTQIAQQTKRNLLSKSRCTLCIFAFQQFLYDVLDMLFLCIQMAYIIFLYSQDIKVDVFTIVGKILIINSSNIFLSNFLSLLCLELQLYVLKCLIFPTAH